MSVVDGLERGDEDGQGLTRTCREAAGVPAIWAVIVVVTAMGCLAKATGTSVVLSPAGIVTGGRFAPVGVKAPVMVTDTPP